MRSVPYLAGLKVTQLFFISMYEHCFCDFCSLVWLRNGQVYFYITHLKVGRGRNTLGDRFVRNVVAIDQSLSTGRAISC